MASLIIAEKNKAAKAIAEALGPVNSIKKSKSLSVYYVSSKDIYVIPLRGHIMEYHSTEKFKSWLKSNPRDIITDPKSIEKVPNAYAPIYIKTLREYARICDFCIIGTDADIEGCNIGLFDAFPFIKKSNKGIKISQLWLSSLEKNEIQKKFQNQISPKWKWGECGEARAIIDAIIGFSSTREVTRTFKPMLERIQQKFVSIGRVQTSLLYLISLREEKIKNFIPDPYWLINAELKFKKDNLNAHHQLNPFDKKNEHFAKIRYEHIKNEKVAVIINKSKSLKKKNPPTPLNTSKALILLTKNLGISAQVALKTMNDLYLEKIISYPRTDSDVYKDDFDHQKYIKNFNKHSELGAFSVWLIQNNRFNPTKGKKDAGDHPPITPLKSLELNSAQLKNQNQRKVYNLLARHFLALFGEAATESTTQLHLNIREEPFSAKAKVLIKEGFFKIAPFLKSKYQFELNGEKGEYIPIESIRLEKKETKPPPKYSDTSLLKLMELNNLGTKSTRPIIIQILVKRGLIFRKGRSYYISNLGSFLIEQLKKVWLPFLKPDFTKYVESQLDNILSNRSSMESVVNNIKKRFLDLFDKFLSQKEEISAEITNFIKNSEIINETEKSSLLKNVICPACKKSLMLYLKQSRYRFLQCSNLECKIKINIPQSGYFKALDSKCLICGFNIFNIKKKKGKKSYSYYICPKCWTEGSEFNPKRTFCSQCTKGKIEKNTCILLEDIK
ncbi:MAG: DNA topoisomerase [Promethearchaeota archaeon]